MEPESPEARAWRIEQELERKLSRAKPLTIEYLTELAYVRRWLNQADMGREELRLTYDERPYSVNIIDAEQEGRDPRDGRWEMGISLYMNPLLEEGIEFFDTLDEAIVSAILTVLEYHGEITGTWRCVRAGQK